MWVQIPPESMYFFCQKNVIFLLNNALKKNIYIYIYKKKEEDQITDHRVS